MAFFLTLIMILMLFGLGWFILSTFNKAVAEYRQLFNTSTKPTPIELIMYINPGLYWQLALSSLVMIFIVLFMFTRVASVSLLFALFCISLPKIILHFMKNSRMKEITHQLPDFLYAVSRSMQAGSSFNQALEIAIEEEKGPIGEEFALVLREVRVGSDFSRSLENLAVRVPVDEIKLVISAINISRETGGNLSETIYRISDTLRKKIQMEGKVKALTAQGKLQGITMSILPFMVGFVLYQLEPVNMARLFTDPVGWFFLTLIISMEIIGYLFIQKIVDIDV